MRAKVTLKKGKEFPVRKFHPWIYSGAIESAMSDIEVGDLVEVYSYDDHFLAIGYWNGGGIAIKILSFSKTEIDLEFWNQKIQKAKRLRQESGLFSNPATNAFRIFNAEGDGVPGLIVDKFADNIVVQLQSLSLDIFRSQIISALKNSYPEAKAFILNTSLKAELVEGEIESDHISENGMKFRVDFLNGQKTGFFLDQRDNREIVKKLSKDKNVLNAFCYSGGFSIAALQGGAKHVTSVDSSKDAMEILSTNLGLNGCSEKHTSTTADLFEFIREGKEKYDLIVLDPPAFCKHRDAVENAIKGYTNLNQQTMLRLSEGGVLLTFSCSQLVSKDRFREAVLLAASRAGKHFKIIRELQASSCHPVSLAHQEGEYLKGLLLIEA